MRPRRRSVDHGLWIILVFCLISVLPLLTRPGLPRDTNLELYEMRSLQVARLIQQGVFYSRWAPEWHYGFGAPLLNYLAPLPHYLAGLHQAVTDSTPVDSIKLLMALTIAVAGTGMYQFARGRWGMSGGIVAGLAYLYSGPVALTLPYYLGDLSLLMALSLLPWTAWSFDRLWRYPDKRTFYVALVVLTAFILSDARLAALGSAALLAVILSGRHLREGAAPGAWRYVLGVIALAVGLTAFFWLPAVAETGQVHWLSARPDNYAGPLTLTESLGPLPRPDQRMLNAPEYRGMGIAVWLLALAGAAASLARRTTARDPLLFAILGIALVTFTTPPLYVLWPSPAVFQAPVPYHAVLIATFCLAATGAASAHWTTIQGERLRVLLLPLLCLAPPVAAFPALYPPAWGPRLTTTTAFSSLQQELQGYHIATLRSGILLPNTAPQLPPPLPNAVEVFGVEHPDRVNRRALPAEAQMDAVEQGPLSVTYIVNTQDTVDVRLHILYTPAWQARLAEQPLPLTVTPDGFISLRVPTFNGELSVWLGSTPAQDAATLITAGSGLLLLLASRRRWRVQTEFEAVPAGLCREVIAGLLIGVALYAVGVLWLRERPDLLLPRSARGAVAGSFTALPRFLQGGIDLLGYDMPSGTAARGGVLRLTVYWQAARPIVENNQSEVWLIDPISRQRMARVAHRHPGYAPTLRWPLDLYVRDTFELTLPPDLPPGDYLLQVAIGPCATRDLAPCEQIQGMDAFTATGAAELGAVTIPEVVRVRTP
jgi:GNAT superfamily N-acetyltransferase